MARMGNHVVGMEEKGELIYDDSRREYVPQGRVARGDVKKHRKQRVSKRRNINKTKNRRV